MVGAQGGADGFVFEMKRDGDGTVPRDLAETDGITRYYTRGSHGGLCNRGDVIAATVDLIGTGMTRALSDQPSLLTRESAGIEDIAAETLAARRQVSESALTLTETDYTGDFLDHPAEGFQEPPAAETIGPVPFPAAPRGLYPVDLLDEARDRWERSANEREGVERSIQKARPLEAETPERLNAYARRLRTQVSVGGEREAPELVGQLTTAISVMERGDSASMPRGTTAFLERVIGDAEEFLSVMFVKRAVAAARSVGRVIRSDTGRGMGTGFLVAPGILMTNHHVLRDATEARNASIQFLYELEIDSRETTGHVFRLEPDRLFHADRDLDMAIVAVAPASLDGAQLDSFGMLPLVSAEGKIRKGQPVNIVQHPLAGRKQIVFRESILSALPEDADHVAHYTGDTQPGSSGSPVFSDRWEVVALHHSGVPDRDGAGNYLTMNGTPWNAATDPEGNSLKWVANEGIRISRIMRHLAGLPAALEAQSRPGADLVRSVLEISRTATEKGVFHADGRAASVHETMRPPPKQAKAQGENDGTVVTVPLTIRVGIGSVKVHG